MLPLLIGAAAAPMLGGVIGNMASAGDRARAQAAYDKAQAKIEALGNPPNPEQIILDTFKQEGALTPELEEAILLDASKVSQIQEDQGLKDAQRGALNTLLQRGKVGLAPEDRLALAQIQQETQAQAEGKRQQIIQSMQSRGMGGAGAELAAALVGSQGAADQASMSGRQMAAQAALTKMGATGQAAQLAGDLIILQGIKSFKITAVEPQVNTADGSGYKTVTGELPYEYEVMFDNNGVNVWKALRKLNSKDAYNCAFYDVEGNKIFTTNKAGTVFKGFQTKMLFTGQYKGKEGNNPAEVKMNIQLADNGEMERQVWISGETLDFDAKSDLDGINDLYLGTTSTVTNASLTWSFTNTLADRSQYVAGIPLTNWAIRKVTTAGIVSYIIPSAVSENAVTKTYTLTHAALGTGATFSVITATTPTPTSIVSNTIQNSTTKLLYKGASAGVAIP